jgi:hypothetical protein
MASTEPQGSKVQYQIVICTSVTQAIPRLLQCACLLTTVEVMRSINPISCINRSLHPLPLRPVPTCSVVVGDAVACSSALLTTYSRTCGLHSARTPRATTQLSSGASEHETLAQAARLTLEVQKSKFIATAFPVATGNQALECIRSASDPSASHNCW